MSVTTSEEGRELDSAALIPGGVQLADEFRAGWSHLLLGCCFLLDSFLIESIAHPFVENIIHMHFKTQYFASCFGVGDICRDEVIR